MSTNTNSKNTGVHAYSFADISEEAEKETQSFQWICNTIRDRLKSKIIKDCLLLPVFLFSGIVSLYGLIFWNGISGDKVSLVGAIVVVLGSVLFTWIIIRDFRRQLKAYKSPLELEPLKTAIMSGIRCTDICSAIMCPEISLLGVRVGKRCLVQSDCISNVFPLESVSNITLCTVGKSYISLSISINNGFKLEEKVASNEVDSLDKADARLTQLVHEMVAYCPNAKVTIATRTK